MANFSASYAPDQATPGGYSSTFGPVYGQQQQAQNPFVVKPIAPLPVTRGKAKAIPKNPFLPDPVSARSKNPFLIPLIPNADLFGLNIPS